MWGKSRLSMGVTCLSEGFLSSTVYFIPFITIIFCLVPIVVVKLTWIPMGIALSAMDLVPGPWMFSLHLFDLGE